MEVIDVLRKARALIAIGWCRGRAFVPRKGKMCFCTLGAISCAGDDFAAKDAAKAMMKDYLGVSSLARWNDAQKSKDSVLRAFDAVIAAEEARER